MDLLFFLICILVFISILIFGVWYYDHDPHLNGELKVFVNELGEYVIRKFHIHCDESGKWYTWSIEQNFGSDKEGAFKYADEFNKTLIVNEKKEKFKPAKR